MRTQLYQQGFALPTILITSVIMLIVLVSAATAASSVNAALDRDFYKQLAREAAESGIVRAVDCLKDNNYVAQWAIGSYLYPGTPCTGGPSTCVAAGSCDLIAPLSSARSRYRTTFTVYRPSSFPAAAQSQNIQSAGRVQLLRPDNSMYEEITVTASLRVPKSTSVDDVDAIIFGE